MNKSYCVNCDEVQPYRLEAGTGFWECRVCGCPIESYPLAAPCEYCGDPVWDHSPSELRSCVIDLEARERYQVGGGEEPL